ncbi:hypothetical protein RHIZO_02662 [Rhizobiaceae bacterium]|nr:hypothetical protein RHIZO_02662 [Rhizobiaceae bacterium]
MAEPNREEVERWRDSALRRALTTPPKPKQESVKRKEKTNLKKQTPAK